MCCLFLSLDFFLGYKRDRNPPWRKAVVGAFVCLVILLVGTAYSGQGTGTFVYSAREICGLLVGAA